MVRKIDDDILQLIIEISGYPAWELRKDRQRDRRPVLLLRLTEDEEQILRHDSDLPIGKFIEEHRLRERMFCRTGQVHNEIYNELYIFSQSQTKIRLRDLKESVESLRDKTEDFQRALRETLLELGACSQLKWLCVHVEQNATGGKDWLEIHDLYETARSFMEGMPANTYISMGDFLNTYIDAANHSKDPDESACMNVALDKLATLAPVLAPDIEEKRAKALTPDRPNNSERPADPPAATC